MKVYEHHHNERKQPPWLLLVLTASLFSPSAPSVLLASRNVQYKQFRHILCYLALSVCDTSSSSGFILLHSLPPFLRLISFQFPTCTLILTFLLYYLFRVLHLSLFHYLSSVCAIMSLMSLFDLESLLLFFWS